MADRSIPANTVSKQSRSKQTLVIRVQAWVSPLRPRLCAECPFFCCFLLSDNRFLHLSITGITSLAIGPPNRSVAFSLMRDTVLLQVFHFHFSLQRCSFDHSFVPLNATPTVPEGRHPRRLQRRCSRQQSADVQMQMDH